MVACKGGPDTRHLVSAAVIDALGPNGTLINVARGSVVDEPALIAALAEGRLGHAALDVFESEPDVSPELLRSPNVIVQPHHGSATIETRTAIGQLMIDNHQRALRRQAAAHAGGVSAPISRLSFRGAPLGASPESITTAWEYGFRARGLKPAPRNDGGGWCYPKSLRHRARVALRRQFG